MKKLKIALLWHFHQPYYKHENEFFLPWVRLHGVKDYWDLPELFYEFPKIKQTINIVPSLWVQIQQYVSGECRDRIQKLTMMNPKDMTDEVKQEVLRLFFLANPENMIRPYQRYNELMEKKHANAEFSDQDIIDLQVWYNLCWIGNFSRKRPAVQSLLIKAKDFDEKDKELVLEIHREILSQVETQLKTLEKLNRIEVSVSPFHHPILPLLVDSKSVNESIPNAILPENIFEFPEDALSQVQSSIDYYKHIFSKNPSGMWPSEGSISDKVLELVSGTSIKWLATDEMVLSNSLKTEYKSIYKYFPIKYKNDNTEMTLFFRDHSLSDAIGFVYSNWNPKDAAGDFLNKLANIRYEIINSMGENELDNAVVPIILDGENCWEYYHNNGEMFLRELFTHLSNSSIVETVLFNEVLQLQSEKIPVVNHVQAGSWINANFNIWAGHKDHRIAWSILSETRKMLKSLKHQLAPALYKQCMEYIYICEGSDWFWWYGDSHWAENKYDFDTLFRYNLSLVYKLLDIEVPDILNYPINKQAEHIIYKPSSERIKPCISLIKEDDWQNAGFYLASSSMSAMHQIGEIIEKIYFGNSLNNIFLRIKLNKTIEEKDRILFEFDEPISCNISIKQSKIEYSNPNIIQSVSLFDNELIIVLKVNNLKKEQYLTVTTHSNESIIKYPVNGKIEINYINGDV